MLKYTEDNGLYKFEPCETSNVSHMLLYPVHSVPFDSIPSEASCLCCGPVRFLLLMAVCQKRL